MKTILYTLGLLALLVTGSCTAFKKDISKPVVIAMPDTNFVAEIQGLASLNKYSPGFTGRQLAQAFLSGFKREAGITKNVTLAFDPAGADYVIKVKSLLLKETTILDTIRNPKSEFNGRLVELSQVESSVVLEISNAAGKKLPDCTNSKIRSEKETNNRSMAEVLSGSNKDKLSYRTKLLADNIALTLSEDVGRRIWTPLSRRIANNSK